MRRQPMKGMDRARDAETEGQKERLGAEWMERMIQQRYSKREKRKYMQRVGQL